MNVEFSRTANEKDDRHNETIKAPTLQMELRQRMPAWWLGAAAVAGIIAGAVLMLLFG